MTDILRKTAFIPCLNDRFLVYPFENQPVELQLVEISDASTERTESFSLIFWGPLEKPFGQGTYRVDHPRLGEFLLFLVPVDRKADGMRYEAVFNLILG